MERVHRRGDGVRLLACQAALVFGFLGGVLCGAPTAWAGGYWTFERGASLYGRGGAGIAQPQDPVALYINPAGLAGLSGLQLLVDANVVFDQRTFTRKADELQPGLPNEYEPVSNQRNPFPPSPGLFAAYNLAGIGLPEATLGCGVYGPPRSDVEWPRPPTGDGPQRYSQVTSHNIQVHQTCGFGVALPWLGLRLGGALVLTNQIVDSALAMNAGVGWPEDPMLDLMLQLDAEENFIPTGIVGLSVQPLPNVTLAGSYQHGWSVNAHGNAKVTHSLNEALLQISGSALDIQFRLPAIARGAVQYDAGTWNIELAYTWENWRVNDVIKFVPRDITYKTAGGEETALAEIPLQTRFRDTYSWRLGGEWKLVPDLLRLRAGAFFERGGVDPVWTSPGAFGLDQVGGTLGARVELPWGLWTDVVGGMGYWLSRQVDNSKVDIVELQSAREPWPIGNGTYENQQWILIASLGARIDL